MAEMPSAARARQLRLVAMGDALQAASAQADWDRLGALSAALGPALRTLAAHGPWNPAERAALQRLRGLHDEAAAGVAAQLSAVGTRLDEMRANQDGWRAYALHSETDYGASQE